MSLFQMDSMHSFNEKDSSLANSGVSRRQFLKVSGATGAAFTLGITLPAYGNVGIQNAAFEPNAFIKIYPNNEITFLIKHLDMGQGAYTGLSTLLAEELDADWNQVKAEHAPADRTQYAHIGWGPTQSTGGSSGLRDAYMQMREAGAIARSMLLAAAAQNWKIDIAQLTTKSGAVVHPNGSTLAYGELAAPAALQPVPEVIPALKKPDDFRFIGKKISRKDTGKENGTAIYTQDLQFDNMLTAVVLHPPRFGANLKSYDASKAKQYPGVVAIVEVPNGLAVLAESFWPAKKGRDLLVVEWDEIDCDTTTCTELMSEYKTIADTEGDLAFSSGNLEEGFNKAIQTVELEAEFPYLAHATMEPMNCVALVENNRCEIWSGVQSQTAAQDISAGILGLSPQQVKVNTVFAGGSFGRRGETMLDYVSETIHIAKQAKGIPVKLVWTREDDMRAGFYRPMYFHKHTAGLDKDGQITAWKLNIVGQSILKGTYMESWGVQNNIDRTTVDGLSEIPYRVGSHRIETNTTNSLTGVPTLWWRAVGNTHTAFAKEVMIDKLAMAAKQDPYQFRKGLLDPKSRDAKVMELAIGQSRWGEKMPKGWGRGLAVHKSFGTYVAIVAEVEIEEKGGFRVDNVVCAVDCGVPVNPGIIEAQMQGGIGYGLGGVIESEVTLLNGVVQEDNFHTHKVVRMNQMPHVTVHITPSVEPPTGVGEPSTCVIPPAVVNAIADATGKFYTKLPIKSIS